LAGGKVYGGVFFSRLGLNPTKLGGTGREKGNSFSAGPGKKPGGERRDPGSGPPRTVCKGGQGAGLGKKGDAGRRGLAPIKKKTRQAEGGILDSEGVSHRYLGGETPHGVGLCTPGGGATFSRHKKKRGAGNGRPRRGGGEKIKNSQGAPNPAKLKNFWGGPGSGGGAQGGWARGPAPFPGCFKGRSPGPF